MELANVSELQDLLGPLQAPKPTRLKRDDGGAPATKQHATVARRRCKCGRCLGCIDNAKWERIFQEKFADPTYYSKRRPSLGSSLAFLS